MPAKPHLRTTNGRGRLFDSVLDTIGDTPCIRINNLGPKGVTIYVKAEFFNPAASVKDRLAVNIIEAAERDGTLKPGQTVVEATSGNTGIGLAMVCAQKGYPLVVTMADSFSIERRKLMRILGAKVVLTPRAAEGLRHVPEGGRAGRGQRLVPGAPVRDAGQRRDPRGHHGARDHRRLQGRAARLFRHRLRHRRHGGRRRAACCASERPETKIILCEPANAQLVGSGKAQERGADGSPAVSHPAFEPHPIQGWTPDFIPLVLQEAIDKKYYDELVPIAGAEGMKWARALAQKEGIFTGISGGSTFAVAMQVAEKAPAGLGDPLRCCPTPASATSRRRCSTASPRTWTRRRSRISKSTPGYQMM